MVAGRGKKNRLNLLKDKREIVSCFYFLKHFWCLVANWQLNFVNIDQTKKADISGSDMGRCGQTMEGS